MRPRPLRTRHWSLALAAVLALLPVLASAVDFLPSWNEGASKQRIVAFVQAVTDLAGPQYVPPGDRIAVFDNDGTLWSEQPMYFQIAFVLDRIRALAPQHPEWSAREPFKSAIAGDVAGVAAGGERGLFELIAATQAGTTSEEFSAIVSGWLATARHPKLGRAYVELTYAPMRELLAYLRANGFKTYIATAGGSNFLRAFSARVYGVPPDQVIGSSFRTRYDLRDGRPEIVLLPEIEFVNDQADKAIGIDRHIGRRPILAFGNSDGDFEMLEFTTGATGPRLGLIVHHDDAAREFAYDRESNVGRLARGLDEAAARGWVIVSMKSDWGKVYDEPAR